MAKYISFLREYIKNKKINLVLMLNDLRWQHALSIEICKELDIKYIVFEQGYFRPNTITMDFKGVNANSSLCNINLKDIKYTKKEIRSYRLIFYKKYQTILKFSLFIFLNKIGKLCNLNVECQNKQYSFVSYFKNFISKNFIRNKKDDYNLPDKFIYVPLQVNTDTQILIHSDFCDMQEFIDVVENSFYSFNKKNDIKLVFNIHPMEKGTHKYKFDDKTIISNAPTRILIQKSLFVITINSTVGLESLIEHKNLIVLGNAFYKLKEICICSDKLNLKNDIKKLICKDAHINFKLVDSFLDYIKYEYLVNGNFYNYDKNTLEECCAKYYSSMNI